MKVPSQTGAADLKAAVTAKLVKRTGLVVSYRSSILHKFRSDSKHSDSVLKYYNQKKDKREWKTESLAFYLINTEMKFL